MNWFSFILFTVILSIVIQSTFWSMYDSSPEKEVPCYDEHNNQIKDLVCINKHNTIQNLRMMIIISIILELLILIIGVILRYD